MGSHAISVSESDDLFELEVLDASHAPEQTELFFPERPEKTSSTQIEFDGMQPQCFTVEVAGKSVAFQHQNNLLESLEEEQVNVHYQCREGYCGSCRVRLVTGQVHYLLEPMAWLNDNEVLTCCSVPKTHLKLQLL